MLLHNKVQFGLEKFKLRSNLDNVAEHQISYPTIQQNWDKIINEMDLRLHQRIQFQTGFNVGIQFGKNLYKKNTEEIQREFTQVLSQYFYINVQLFNLQIDEMHVQLTSQVILEKPEQLNEELQINFKGFITGFFASLSNSFLFTRFIINGRSGSIVVQPLILFPMEEYAHYLESYFMLNRDFQVTNEKLQNEKKQLQLVMEIHNKLTTTLIEKSEINEIQRVLKNYINKPVIIHQVDGKLINKIHCSEHQVTQWQKEFMSQYKSWRIKEIKELRCDTHNRLISPYGTAKQIVGYCSIICNPQQEITEIERMLLGILTTICSLIYVNEKNIFEANERTKGVLFEKMLANEFESKEQMERELNLLKIDQQGQYHITFLSLKYNVGYTEEQLSIFTNIYQDVIKFFGDMDFEVLIVQRSNGVLCFIPAARSHESLEDGPSRFYRRIKKYFKKLQCHIGISSTSSNLSQVNQLMEEAMICTKFTTNVEPIIHFDDLGLLGILVNMKDKTMIHKMAKLELTPLYNF